MKVILAGRRQVARECLALLLKRGHDVSVLHADVEICENASWLGVPLISEVEPADAVFSVLYPRRLPEGCINFHPAPLPGYRGFAPYTFGILNRETKWGVTAHYTDDGIDTGDIIMRQEFDIDPDMETAESLRRKSHMHLYFLFEKVLDNIDNLPRNKQGKGRYYSRKDFERERQLKEGDDIVLKTKAFFCPPYPGVIKAEV